MLCLALSDTLTAASKYNVLDLLLGLALLAAFSLSDKGGNRCVYIFAITPGLPVQATNGGPWGIMQLC